MIVWWRSKTVFGVNVSWVLPMVHHEATEDVLFMADRKTIQQARRRSQGQAREKNNQSSDAITRGSVYYRHQQNKNKHDHIIINHKHSSKNTHNELKTGIETAKAQSPANVCNVLFINPNIPVFFVICLIIAAASADLWAHGALAATAQFGFALPSERLIFIVAETILLRLPNNSESLSLQNLIEAMLLLHRLLSVWRCVFLH